MAGAQNAQPRAAFEVASVRPNTSIETASIGGLLEPSGRFVIVNAPLRQIIRVAYQRPITGGPSWIDSSRFDVTAKADAGTPPPRAWLMLRTLLEERFRLRVHEERQEVAAYALVLARDDGRLGTGIHRSDFDCGAAAQRGERSAFEARNGQPARCAMEIGRGGRLIGRGINLGQLAGALSKLTGRTVLNRTDLTGSFDVQLSWTPDQQGGAPGPAVPSTSTGTSIFTALREQLELELKSDRDEIEVIVVDGVERPSPN